MNNPKIKVKRVTVTPELCNTSNYTDALNCPVAKLCKQMGMEPMVGLGNVMDLKTFTIYKMVPPFYNETFEKVKTTNKSIEIALVEMALGEKRGPYLF